MVNLHILEQKVQIVFFFGKLLWVRSVLLLNLNGKGDVAQLLLVIDRRQLLRCALQRNLRDLSIREVNHLIQVER